MAFSSQTAFDLRLKHGITEEWSDPIVITGNGAREVRRRQQKYPRRVWTYQSRVLPVAEYNTMRARLTGGTGNANYNSSYSFRILDPLNPYFQETTLTSAGTTYWKMFVKMNSATTDIGHPYYNPILSGQNSIQIYKNGAPVNGATCSMVYVDGEPRLNIPGSVITDTILVSGLFFATVRLEGTISATTVTMKTGEWRGTHTPASTNLFDGNTDVEATYVNLGEFKLIEVWEHA
jgi:hypothetical protein